jgi:dolichol kinase
MLNIQNYTPSPAYSLDEPFAKKEQVFEELGVYISSVDECTSKEDNPLVELTDLNRNHSVEFKQEALLSIASNTLGTTVAAINIDEGVDGVVKASKIRDLSSLVDSLFRACKGFFEMIEKTLSTTKTLFEGFRVSPLSTTTSLALGSTILAGASGACLSLLAVTSLQAKACFNFTKKYKKALANAAQNPQESLKVAQDLSKELSVSQEEKTIVLHKLLVSGSLVERMQQAFLNVFSKQPQMAELKKALLDPSSSDLKTLASNLTLKNDEKILSILPPSMPENFQSLSKEDKLFYLKILQHCYQHELEQVAKQKMARFTKIFGDDIQHELLQIAQNPNPSPEQSHLCIQKALLRLCREERTSYVKLLGAMLISAATILTQICTHGAFYIAESVIAVAISILSLIAEMQALIKCCYSNDISLEEKIKTAILSIAMICVTTVSCVVLRLTISPVATTVLSVSWILLSVYTLVLWLSKKTPQIPLNS